MVQRGTVQPIPSASLTVRPGGSKPEGQVATQIELQDCRGIDWINSVFSGNRVYIFRGEATPYLGPYLATYARLLGKGLPSLPGLPDALPGLLGTLPCPYLAYLALT